MRLLLYASGPGNFSGSGTEALLDGRDLPGVDAELSAGAQSAGAQRMGAKGLGIVVEVLMPSMGAALASFFGAAGWPWGPPFFGLTADGTRRSQMVSHGHKLGHKKETAIEALLTHRNVEEAAQVIGVPEEQGQ